MRQLKMVIGIAVAAWIAFAVNGQEASKRSGSTTNLPSSGDLTITNQAGQVFTMQDFARQLQGLRSSVEQTLPMLTAFNERFSSASGQSLAGALSELISGALKKNGSEGPQSGGSSTQMSNVLSALGGLFSTNAQGSVSVNTETLRDLTRLQEELKPVSDLLGSMNLGTGTNQLSTTPAGGLTPTGR
jgi:hypothetical protein